MRSTSLQAVSCSEVEARSLLLKENVVFVAVRRVASISILGALGFCGGLALLPGTAHAQTQTSDSSPKLPPPPTIDENVNRNLTLADVRYDNKYDVYGGIGFYHANAGPQLIGGSNLGGFDLQGTRWLTSRLGVTASARGDYGTIGVSPNPYGIKGPFIMEHLGLGGVTFRARRGKPAAVDFHGLFGVNYGVFDHALGNLPPPATGPVPPAAVGLFNNQASFAMALGGSLDLNRSPQLAFRISPDYVYTSFGGITQNEFAISVGILYRLKFPKGSFKARPQ